MGGGTEHGSGNTSNPIIPDYTHPHACIHHSTPADGHGERKPEIINFIKA